MTNEYNDLWELDRPVLVTLVTELRAALEQAERERDELRANKGNDTVMLLDITSKYIKALEERDEARAERDTVRIERDAAQAELANKHTLFPMPAWVCPRCGRSHPMSVDGCPCFYDNLKITTGTVSTPRGIEPRFDNSDRQAGKE